MFLWYALCWSQWNASFLLPSESYALFYNSLLFQKQHVLQLIVCIHINLILSRGLLSHQLFDIEYYWFNYEELNDGRISKMRILSFSKRGYSLISVWEGLIYNFFLDVQLHTCREVAKIKINCTFIVSWCSALACHDLTVSNCETWSYNLQNCLMVW